MGMVGRPIRAVEAANKGVEEATIVEERVDRAQLVGEQSDDLREYLLPERGLAIVEPEHPDLRTEPPNEQLYGDRDDKVSVKPRRRATLSHHRVFRGKVALAKNSCCN
jgi:hypothetical protein